MKTKAVLFGFILIFTSIAGISEAQVRKPDRFITKNGITVLLLERDALPFITVNVTVRAGSVFDPAGLSGLANITADLLTEGTKSRTASEISEEIDFIGGEISSSGGIDYASASVKTLSRDREKGFELLSDILMNPSFPAEEVERIRSQIRASIISKEDDPEKIVTERFNEILFDGHPYSRPADGNLESIEKISGDDIKSFYKAYYSPNNTIIAVVGDISSGELKRLLNKYFAGWKKNKVKLPGSSKAAPLKKRVVEVIDKDLTQATVQLGHMGVKRETDDFHALYVMNYILGGGGFVSRLMTEVRDNRGLVYNVYSYFNPLKDPGPFKVGLQTKNESALEAVEEVIAQLQKIAEKGVTEKELRDAKDYLVGSFLLKFTTNQKISSYLTYIEIYNLGLDYLDRFPVLIENLSVEDVNRAAEKYLDPDNFLLVVAGSRGKMPDMESLKTGDERPEAKD